MSLPGDGETEYSLNVFYWTNAVPSVLAET